jgi:hypothetical protein
MSFLLSDLVYIFRRYQLSVSVQMLLVLWEVFSRYIHNKIAKLLYVCVSQVTTQELLNGFSLNFILRSYTEICWHIPILVNMRQQLWALHVRTYTHQTPGTQSCGESAMMTLSPIQTGNRHSAHTKVIDPRQLWHYRCHLQRSKVMFWQKKWHPITSCIAYKRRFVNWKSRGNNRVNTPELLCFIMFRCVSYVL